MSAIKDTFRQIAGQTRARRLAVDYLPAEFNGARLFVCAMSGEEGDSLDRSNYRVRRVSGRPSQEFIWEGARARYVSRCLRDAEGALVFDPEDADDLQTLGALPFALLDRLYEDSRKVNTAEVTESGRGNA